MISEIWGPVYWSETKASVIQDVLHGYQTDYFMQAEVNNMADRNPTLKEAFMPGIIVPPYSPYELSVCLTHYYLQDQYRHKQHAMIPITPVTLDHYFTEMKTIENLLGIEGIILWVSLTAKKYMPVLLQEIREVYSKPSDLTEAMWGITDIVRPYLIQFPKRVTGQREH